MSEMFLWLLGKSILLTVITLLTVEILRRFAVHQVSATVRHWLCRMAFLGLLLLPLLSGTLPNWKIVVPVYNGIPGLPATATTRVAPRVPPGLNKQQAISSSTAGLDSEETSQKEEPVAKKLRTSIGAEIYTLLFSDPLTAFLPTWRNTYIPSVFWLLIILRLNHQSLGKLVRRAKRVTLWIPTNLPVFESSEITVPLTVGIGKKAVVVLPIGSSTHLSHQHLAAILAHENAHIQRQDYLWQLIASSTCIFYFWNPFAWFLGRMLREEAEQAADDWVISENGIRPSDYASYLLETVRGVRHRWFVSIAAVTMAQRSDIRSRIDAILSANRARGVRLSLPAFIGLSLTCLSLIAGIAVLAPAKGAESKPVVALAKRDSAFRKTLTDGTEVELLFVARGYTDQVKNPTFWKPDGQLITGPRPYPSLVYTDKIAPASGRNIYELAIVVRGPRSNQEEYSSIADSDAYESRQEQNSSVLGKGGSLIHLQLDNPTNALTFRVGIPRKRWSKIYQCPMNQFPNKGYTHSFGVLKRTPIQVSRPKYVKEHTVVDVLLEGGKLAEYRHAWAFSATLKNGTKVFPPYELVEAHSYKNKAQLKGHISFAGDITRTIQTLHVNIRPYDWVTFSGVAVKPKPREKASIPNSSPQTGLLYTQDHVVVTGTPKEPIKSSRSEAQAYH